MNFFKFQYLIIKDITILLFSFCFLWSLFFNTFNLYHNQKPILFFFNIFLILISIFSSKNNLLRYVYLLSNKKEIYYLNKIKKYIFNDILFLIFVISYFNVNSFLKYYIIFINLFTILTNFHLIFCKKKEKKKEKKKDFQFEIELQSLPPIQEHLEPDIENPRIGELSFDLPEYKSESIYK